MSYKKRDDLTRHHRKPRSKQGTNDDRNISLVFWKKHEAYHLLFGNKSPEEVAKILTETWIDPDFVLLAIHREKGISLAEISQIVKPSKNKLNPPPDDYEG